ncbi:MAG: NmrA/HSCARG family protein [Acidobacteriota bacterium]|nr:MAG: NmrA/HSCARG family protein [Acidobacteriota bacterium]
MAEKKVIVVVGATGAQGGGLVRAILADPAAGFAARALTRNVDSERARQLASMGAEVTQADLDDPESLRRAFEGAYGAFCITNFWEHFSPEKELAQAEAMAKAAHETGLKHVIWSTLEDTRRWISLDDDRMPTLMGHYKVPHFDAKGEADDVFRKHAVPTTFLLTSFYWDNLIHLGMGPKKDPEGRVSFTLPMGGKKLPGIAAKDIGGCAFGIFKAGSQYIGKTLGIAGEHLTGQEMAQALSKTLNREIHFNDVSPSVYRSFGFPGADDLGNMFQFKSEFSEVFVGNRNLEESRRLNPQLQTFAEWLKENASRIQLDPE